MRNRNFSSLVLVLFLILASVTGCWRGDRPELGEVSGSITLDGRPLPYARIGFRPELGRPSGAQADEAGRYSLNYIRNIRGAKIGKHSVTISTFSPGEADPAGNRIPSCPELLPAKYNTASKLTAEVKQGKNVINFDLKSK